MTMLSDSGDIELVEDHSTLEASACLFHALSDQSRLKVLEHLKTGEHRVVDLTKHLGLAQSTVSKHLACLYNCGLVTVRIEGRASVYSLAHCDATTNLLAAAESLLTLTGQAAAECTTNEHGDH